ncbi:PREDICTED: huntingtin-interacting protein 1-related protein [Pygoscelis adeliae]|nr:PREDICTED: huntingtin-interacting protein 1-related protein [Pygoscelis adeliae]
MGGKIDTKRNLPALTQPKRVSAKGSYYAASWSVKLCGTGFLTLINFDPRNYPGSILKFCCCGYVKNSPKKATDSNAVMLTLKLSSNYTVRQTLEKLVELPSQLRRRPLVTFVSRGGGWHTPLRVPLPAEDFTPPRRTTLPKPSAPSPFPRQRPGRCLRVRTGLAGPGMIPDARGSPEDPRHIFSPAESRSRAQPLYRLQPFGGLWRCWVLWERQLRCKCLFPGIPGSLTFRDKRITASHRLNSAAALRPHMAGVFPKSAGWPGHSQLAAHPALRFGVTWVGDREGCAAADGRSLLLLQAISISKAINTQEAPVKEKHARRIILGTHHEKGAFTFWSYAIGLPLASSAILSWKFCHVLHKVLRDGHPNVLQDCQRYRSNIRETGDLWGHLHDRYGQLVSIYTRLLLTKISFHAKHPEFPPGLEVSDEVLEKTAGTDVNNIFQLTVELFDYLDWELKLSESVFRQLNTSMAVSQMSAVQCRLAPLIQVIQDCSHLYHYAVKLMFKLHSCLPADTLQGHRDRFHEQFRSLKNFFKKASDMLYFKRLIQIPRLPESPPNFLRASALAEHVKPVVVIPEEAPEDEEPENLIEISTASTTEPQITSDIFEQTFGPPNGIRDDRDAQIESLKKEVDMLRAEMEKIKLEAQRYITQLKAQVNSLEGEVEEQRKQKQKALVDNEQLRDELERLQRAKQDSDRSQRLCAEAEKKANATEIRYTKLKEKHSELINTHAELLRKNADTAKQLTVTQQSQEEVARVKEQLAFQVEQVKREAEMKLEDQSVQMEQLRQELDTRRDELDQAQRSLSHAKQAGAELSAQVEALHAEKEVLRRSVSEKECELLSARGLVEEKELQLSQEADKATREIRELQGRLLEKSNQEQSLQQKLLDEQFGILQETVREAEDILRDAVAKLDDPLHVRCTSSPDYLLSRAQAALESTDTLENGHAQYVASMADAAGLVGALALFAHLTADTIVNGSATSHLAPTDHADQLTETCRDCGQRSLDYLGELKDKQTLARAELGDVRQALRGVLQLAQELRPKSLDIKQEELGDMVEKEMASTSEAIEDAVRRIEEMMSQARNKSSGVKLEVNERILNSCTDLMKAIRLLVMTSTNLQKEIVESGRGAATTQEFYAKNSRWTEGLISASKAVGWGATQLVESADRVVLHTGKYEELIVCSHEIAASTAQLVAASKVKAEKSSRNLSRLQECSRNVNEMAANVVASTKSGQEQIEEKDTMDFSGMSLIKLKKEEMETQVKVLELEKRLEGERVRLGELRKQHYALAGAYDAVEDGEAKPAPAPRRGILKKPPLAQKPGHGEPERDASPYPPHGANF